MKHIPIILAVTALFAVSAVSCGPDNPPEPTPPETISVTGVLVSPTSKEMVVDETLTLSATVQPSNATNKAVSWKSSDTGVASVDGSGLVKAVRAGSATITVTTSDGGKTATCSITVKEKTIPVTGMTISQSSATLFVGGEDLTLTASVVPQNASVQTFQWSVDRSDVATVADGVVHPVSVGTATVTATSDDGGKTATCTVTVEDTRITGISIKDGSAEAIRIEIGSTRQLEAIVLPENATNRKVTWSSSASDIATVSASGLVSFIAKGSVEITATSDRDNSMKATQAFIVTGPLSAIKINGGETVYFEEGTLGEVLSGKTVTSLEFIKGVLTPEEIAVVQGLMLTAIIVPASNPDYSGTSDNTMLLSKDGKTIYAYALGSITDSVFTLPEIENIAAGAFSHLGDTPVTKLIIPEGVKNIAAGAISSSKVTVLTMQSATPPTIAEPLSSTLPSLTAIYVPESAVSTYQNAPVWVTDKAKISSMPPSGSGGGAGNGGIIGDDPGSTGGGNGGGAGNGGTIGDEPGNPGTGGGSGGGAGNGGTISDEPGDPNTGGGSGGGAGNGGTVSDEPGDPNTGGGNGGGAGNGGTTIDDASKPGTGSGGGGTVGNGGNLGDK